jgi:RHS repeat-associated protein
VGAGTYTVKARARSTISGCPTAYANAYRTFTVAAPNQAPAVSMSAPAAGAIYEPAPATITATGTASDDVAVSRVELLIDGQVAASLNDPASSFSLSAGNVAVGGHSVALRAVDGQGASTTTSAVPVTVSTGNRAQFVSQSVPAVMNAGQSYPVSVTFRNTGVTMWTAAANHRLGSQNPSDNSLWGSNRIALPASVAPNANVTISFNVTPPASGTSNFQWRMVQDGVEWFGDASTNVAVRTNAAPSVTLAQPTQTSFGAPATVALSATATDDAGINRVEFWVNGALRHTATAAPYAWTLANAAAGTYSLIARAYDTDGVSREASRSITVVEVLPIAVPNVTAPTGGSLPGAVTVTPAGAATYSIPIAAPPGTTGMVPAVSLGYSSQGGAGLMGIGWGISGLSSIDRCPQTIAQDGTRRAIELNANDRYCLDGQRLILVSGTYGATAEYRTEVDSFSKIQSFGADTAKGPDRWEVRTKDGKLLHFGNTADSLVEAQGKSPVVILRWSLARVQDRKGNYWAVSYDKNTAEGEHYPKQISYTGNSTIATPLAPYAAVRFIYDATRVDPEVDYVAGAKLSTLRRLSKVQTFINIAADGSGGTLVRDFRIGYQQSSESNRSLVQSVQDCDGAGTCLPATTFGWQQQAASERHFNAPGSGVWGGPVPIYSSFNGWVKKNVWNAIAMVDLNGDGKTDLLKTFENGTWQACLSTGSGFDCQLWAGPALKMSDVVTGDFNGDGRTDLIYNGPVGGPLQACLSTGTGFNCIPWPGMASTQVAVWSLYVIGDHNGDGRDDIGFCYSTGTGFDCKPFTIYNWSNNIVSIDPACPEEQIRRRNIPLDHNGDGRTDYLVIQTWSAACPPPPPIGTHSYTWQVYTTVDDGTTRGFVPNGDYPGLPSVNLFTGEIGSTHGSATAHFNNDQHQDLVLQNLPNQGFQVCRTTGQGFACSSPLTDTSVYDYTAHHVADFDGDGRADAIHNVTDSTARVCQLGRSSSLLCATWSKPAVVGIHADFNGDGKTDLASYNDTTQQWSIWLAGGARPDLLCQVTNGIGHVTQLTYKPLSDPGVHTRDAGTAYPMRDVVDATPMVAQVRAANGLGGWLVTDYRYGGMKTDLAGRGSLGVRWMESIDQVSRVTTRTEFRQAWPYTGMVERATATHASGVVLSDTTNTLALKTGCTGAGQLPYVSNTTATTRDLNGAAISTATGSTVVDCYGNPTSSTTSTAAGGETYASTTTSTFDNTTSSWRIGELRCVTVDKTAPGVTSEPRKVKFDYDSAGLLLRETIEPRSGTALCATGDTHYDYEVKVEYTRDVYGNMATRTVRWTEGGTARSRKTDDIVYESKGRFPQTVKNALNHTETRAYSATLGVLTSLTGPNALTTTWLYDSWGRKTKETRADATFTDHAYRQCQSGCVQGAALVSITTPSSGVPSATYIDALGRDVRVQTWSFNGTELLTDHEYDSNGRLWRSALRRVSSAAPVWTAQQHDDLGRVIQSTDPDGVSTITYNGLETTYLNAKNQTRREVRNGLGKLRQVIDHNAKAITYRYEPFGNLERTTDALGNVVAITYDRLGRKKTLNDPNLGLWRYTLNAIGELKEQADPVRFALSQKTSFSYDALGRLTQRAEPDATSTWTYDSCTKGIGKLCQTSGANAYLRKLSYDSLGRVASVSVNLDGTYISAFSYDPQGRVAGATHTRAALNGTTGPAQSFSYLYNSLGFLKEIKSGAGASYWRAEARDAFDRVTREVLGNGLITRSGFHAQTTRLERIATGPVVSGQDTDTVQSETYLHDALGNLNARTFLAPGSTLVTETFVHDGLNRLTSSTIGAATKTYQYNEIGNLTFKTGVGTLNYPTSGTGAVRPHAVASVTGSVNGVTNPSFTFDANGNLTSGAGRSWSWTAANRPKDITQGNMVTAFTYGPERQRVKQTVTVAGSVTKTIHYAGVMEKEISGAVTQVRTYLPNGVGVIIETSGGANPGTVTRYLHRDRLGSVSAISNETGAVLERHSYDPWGKRRNADGTDAASNLTSAIDDTGFTGHEMLDDLGLVHMNGRVYDPVLGRMTSADPLVPDAADQQAFNRYAYVTNNPLGYTDPSGFAPSYSGNPATASGCSASAAEQGNSCNAASRADNALVETPLGLAALGAAIASHFASRTQQLERVIITGQRPLSDPVGHRLIGGASVLPGQQAVSPSLRNLRVVPDSAGVVPGAISQRSYRRLVVHAAQCQHLGCHNIAVDPARRPATAGEEELLEAANDALLSLIPLVGIGKSGAAAKGLPDSALVCRGGLCTADRFAGGSGVTLDAAGNMSGVSVNSAAEKTLKDLSATIPNPKLGVTTVGDVRRAGGDVIPKRTPDNPYHCEMCGITPQQAERLFTPVVPNPNR